MVQVMQTYAVIRFVLASDLNMELTLQRLQTFVGYFAIVDIQVAQVL